MFLDLAEQLAVRKKEGLFRYRQVLTGPQETYQSIAGRTYLSFCSNDYLGLANHPDLIQSANDGARQYGVGAGASHLINGHSVVHHALEEALSSFVHFPRVLLFSTGYMANIGVVTALLGRDDAVFSDKLNHASLNDAALLSRAKFIRYPHCDLAVLEQQLRSSKARRKLVISDGVFSMDGDIAPVKALIALCEQNNAMLLLDDAHGFGVLGKEGAGTLTMFDCADQYVPHVIYMATLGKAAGVFGAFVAAHEDIIETLIQNARSYIYTTATPPLLSHTLLKSLKLIQQDEWRRNQLTQLITHFKRNLQSTHWRLLPSMTPIQPLIIGEHDDALRVSYALREQGILVPAIRPPTVPEGSARLRISLSASHTLEDIEQLISALQRVA